MVTKRLRIYLQRRQRENEGEQRQGPQVSRHDPRLLYQTPGKDIDDRYVKEVVAAWDNAPKQEDDFTLVKSKRGKKSKSCAAPEDLFKVDDDATKMNAETTTI
jgi:hypothetical protein